MSLRSLFFRFVSPRRKPQRRNSRTAIRPLPQRLLKIEPLEGRSMLAVTVGIPALSTTLPGPMAAIRALPGSRQPSPTKSPTSPCRP